MAEGAPDEENFALTGSLPGNRYNKSDQPGFRSLIESLARTRSSALEVFADFARVAACALAAQTREAEYLAVAKNYSRAELDTFAQALAGLVAEMEARPFTDLLGPYYLEIGSKFARDLRGEFYTPKNVGDMMAGILVDAPGIIEAGRPVTVCDPAGGSAGLILSLAEEFAKANAVDLLRVTCQDVSKIACVLAYINLTLWGDSSPDHPGRLTPQPRRSRMEEPPLVPGGRTAAGSHSPVHDAPAINNATRSAAPTGPGTTAQPSRPAGIPV
jgi:hypothetical protein